MRIDINQLQSKNIEDPAVTAAAHKSGSSKAAHIIASPSADGIAFGHSADNLLSRDRSGKKSILDEVSKADAMGVQAQMEQMLVVAQTMSPADAKKLADEGYDMGSMDPKDAVNSLDRMKIRLAEAGVNVAGYTDNVSAEKVAEVTGRMVDTASLAEGAAALGSADPEAFFEADITDAGIAETLLSYDLPATEDNIASVREAVNMTTELKDITDNTRLFLASEGMEPTIENVFRAGFSSGKAQLSGNAKYIADAAGYVGMAGNAEVSMDAEGAGTAAADEGLDRQIDDIIKEAGYEVTSGLKQDALHMINAGVPLTPDTLQIYEDSADIKLRPLKKELMNAIALGGSGKDAYLIADYRNIRAERVMKEAALAMTTEVNRKNLEKDLTIDTGYLERDVESLKTREKEVFDLLEETLSIKNDIQAAPAALAADSAVLDVFTRESADPAVSVPEASDLTLRSVHEKAGDLTREYRRMSDTYEAVGTEVRADLGDSIKKAFANTDFSQVLDDLGREQTPLNERAVRIISYSHMELTAENIDRVSEADARLNAVLDRMTPARVMRLIRDNVNPLETGLSELESRLDGYRDKELRPVEDFARYLVSETNKGNVTDEEAASYIGIYRLVNAINTGDHRAVGNLVAGGAELNFSNLLSAVRTGRKSHVDQYIDSSFGGMDSFRASDSLRIDEMIRTAFDPSSSGEEEAEREAQQFAEAAKAEAEIFRILENAGIAQSADNVNAYEYLMAEGGNKMARELYDRASEGTKERLKSARGRVREDLGKGDADGVKEAYDEMVKAELIASLEGERLDIRAIQSMDKTLSVKSALASAEEYHIPAEFNGELININLRLEHGEKQNSVDIYFETEDFGSVHASLRVTDGIRGALTSDRTAGIDHLKDRLDAVNDAASRVSGKDSYLKVGNTDISATTEAMEGTDTDNAMLYRIAKAALDALLS